MDPTVESLLERGAVLLEPEPARLTEYGKRWFDRIWRDADRHSNTIRDVLRLSELEQMDEAFRWEQVNQHLRDEGVLTNAAGVSQYAAQNLINYVDDKAAFTQPATVTIGLWQSAPTSTSTGALAGEGGYTGYARVTIAAASLNSATAATPSVQTNSATLTFAYTSGGATFLGFQILDSATLAAGNALWYGALTSVTISSTQQPPTIASGALSLSMQ